MYEGAALPSTGVGISIGGSMLGLSWLIAIGLLVIVTGVIVTRFAKARHVGR